MNYCKLLKFDTMNGPGCRVSLFVSGCDIQCPKCFNRPAWNYDYGEPYTKEVEDTIMRYLSVPEIDGISILGGEPFDDKNWKTVLGLVKRIRKELPEKSILSYSGYTKEEIEKTQKKELLDLLDILIDGPYVHELQDLDLPYRGSTNQKIIYLKKEGK